MSNFTLATASVQFWALSIIPCRLSLIFLGLSFKHNGDSEPALEYEKPVCLQSMLISIFHHTEAEKGNLTAVIAEAISDIVGNTIGLFFSVSVSSSDRLTVYSGVGAWEIVLKDRVGYDDPGPTDWAFREGDIYHLIGTALHGVPHISQPSVLLIHVLIVHFLQENWWQI